MDQTTVRVSQDSNGVSQEMADGDARDEQHVAEQGTDDFETRVQRLVNPLVERTADGFRSTVDKKFSSIEPSVRAIPQLQQQLNTVSQALQTLLAQQQAKDEEQLAPEEKDKRNVQRTIQTLQQQANEANLRANAWYYQSQAKDIARDAGVEWFSEDVNWHNDLFNSNPAGWFAVVTPEILRAGNRRRDAAAQRAEDERRQSESVRQRSVVTRRDAEQKNAEQVQAASRFNGAAPDGGHAETSAVEKLARITDPKERRRLIEAQMRQIRKAEGPLELDMVGRSTPTRVR